MSLTIGSVKLPHVRSQKMHRMAGQTLLRFMFFCSCIAPLPAQDKPKQETPAFEQEMNRLVEPYLKQRSEKMAEIKTRAQAEARQKYVRETLLRMLGGLPNNHDPLNAQVVGTISQEGFHIEKLIYDSLPGYHVTANLYLPSKGKGPFPVVIYHAGHAPFGKAEAAFGFAPNLALNGIAVLAYDPLGAGERLQAMNPETGKSWAGPDEHSQAQIPISLIGDHVSRYMVWDAMRGIDYLSTRPDIDAHNIGSFGCSGGGTLSAYLTALDERVKAGVVACYLTSYEELNKGIGPQDGEQVIPDFVKNGLDFSDLVELAAPRGYAMVATTEDMFPFAGASAAHDEAARFYSLYGAVDNLQWFTGPGGHGAILPLMPKMISFFEHWLLHTDNPPPEMVKLPFPKFQEYNCTTTGQVTTTLSGRTIYQINRERANAILPKKTAVSSSASLKALQSHLKAEIPAITGMNTAQQSSPVITVTAKEQRSGYRIETVVFHSRYNMDLPARLALPDSAGPRPALLITSERPIADLTGADSDFDRAAKSGNVVLAMTPLPWPPSPDQPRPTMGTMLPWTSRALIIDKTFVGMRTEDTLAAVQWLATQHEVKPNEIDAYADGASGVVLLHVAVLDLRIRNITIENALSTFNSIVDVPIHRNVAESVIPGVLLHYDLDDLMIAIAPRRISIVNPVDGAGSALTKAAFQDQLARVYATDRSLKLENRITFSTRVSGEPLPILYSSVVK